MKAMKWDEFNEASLGEDDRGGEACPDFEPETSQQAIFSLDKVKLSFAPIDYCSSPTFITRIDMCESLTL